MTPSGGKRLSGRFAKATRKARLAIRQEPLLLRAEFEQACLDNRKPKHLDTCF